MTQKDENRLQTMEMWLWRRMIGGTNWTERRIDKGILEETGEKREDLIVNTMGRKTKFIGRLNDFLNNIFEGRIMVRRRPRPRNNYFHDVEEKTGSASPMDS